MNPAQLPQIRFFQTAEAGPLAFPLRAPCWVRGGSVAAAAAAVAPSAVFRFQRRQEEPES